MESQKFKHIEENLLNILFIMLDNQNLLRYIKYTDDPLSPSLPDIKEDLIGTNIILTPADLSSLVEEVVKVFFNPYNGNLTKYPVANDTYTIDIFVPNTKWLVNGQLRAFRIAHEISKNIDGLNITGIGKVEITNYKISRVNDKISCLTLFVNIGNPTIKV